MKDSGGFRVVLYGEYLKIFFRLMPPLMIIAKDKLNS